MYETRFPAKYSSFYDIIFQTFNSAKSFRLPFNAEIIFVILS